MFKIKIIKVENLSNLHTDVMRYYKVLICELVASLERKYNHFSTNIAQFGCTKC